MKKTASAAFCFILIVFSLTWIPLAANTAVSKGLESFNNETTRLRLWPVPNNSAGIACDGNSKTEGCICCLRPNMDDELGRHCWLCNETEEDPGGKEIFTQVCGSCQDAYWAMWPKGGEETLSPMQKRCYCVNDAGPEHGGPYIGRPSPNPLECEGITIPYGHENSNDLFPCGALCSCVKPLDIFSAEKKALFKKRSNVEKQLASCLNPAGAQGAAKADCSPKRIKEYRRLVETLEAETEARRRINFKEQDDCIYKEIKALKAGPVKTEKKEELPKWVQELIARYKKEPIGNPPGSIWQYRYKEQIVYYIPPQCCDQYSSLYNAQGVEICAPDGGQSDGDGKCRDFYTLKENGVLIWQDARNRTLKTGEK